MGEQNKARWSKTTVTDEGIGLLTEFAAGRLLTITNAFGSVSGSGTSLAELTGLPDGKAHPLTIESVTKSDDGVTVCIQVTSVGNQTAYKLEQIGIFAAAGDDAGQSGIAANEKLLMVIEDVEDENGGKGVTVPAESEQLYAFKLYAVLAITNKERLEVSVSSAGIATVSAIEEAVKGHDTSPEAHNYIAVRIGAMETALNGGKTISGNGDPTVETEGVKGQHYINSVTGEEFVCTGVTEDGCTWEPKESAATDDQNILARIRGIETAVNGGETISGNGDPTVETEGVKGQHYINFATGDEFVCIGVTEDGCAWEPWETVDKSKFAAQPKLSGTPGQVVGFDGMGLAYAVRGWSNPNLLINADFRKPVNRNGKTEYTGVGYTIDRWYSNGAGGGIVQITAQGVSISGIGVEDLSLGFTQFFERDPSLGQTITVSALDSEGVLSTATGLFGQNGINTLHDGNLHWHIGKIGDLYEFVMYTTYPAMKTFVAVKLELGSVQTLAHQEGDTWVLNGPPDYDLQYALCSQYSPITGEWVGSQHSNPNLLDNWYFADPINRRNQQTYETSTDGLVYTLDRWMLSGNSLRSITLASDGIVYSGTGNANIAEKIEISRIPLGQTITISALVENSSNAKMLFRHADWMVFNYADIPDSDDLQLISVSIPNIAPANNESFFMFTMCARDSEDTPHSVKIKAVKLELGSVQTLAHQDADGSWVLNDPPPNKALELAKCQRYMYVFDIEPYSLFGSGIMYTGNSGNFMVQVPAKFRTAPAPLVGSGSMVILHDGNTYDFNTSDVTFGVPNSFDSYVILQITNISSVNIPINSPCLIGDSGNGIQIIFDANL